MKALDHRLEVRHWKPDCFVEGKETQPVSQVPLTISFPDLEEHVWFMEPYKKGIVSNLQSDCFFSRLKNAKRSKKGGYHMDFFFREDYGLPPLYGVWGGLSTMTLLILPGYEITRITLRGRLFRDGQFIREFSSYREFKNIIFLPFVLIGPAGETQQLSRALDFMLDDINRDLRKAFKKDTL